MKKEHCLSWLEALLVLLGYGLFVLFFVFRKEYLRIVIIPATLALTLIIGEWIAKKISDRRFSRKVRP